MEKTRNGRLGMPSESMIERKLRVEAARRGGLSMKFVSPGMDGVPDRIVLLPGGKMAFVELKAPGRRLRPLQEARRRRLESLGFRVFVVDGMEDVGEVLDGIQTA